ncbi:hypothetical protein J8F10_31835 [Gemmata sp. G18]|uniref:DUF4242 domain-containing protein n=1 Tax=Gemmata palustris TaxID=2822762 RepID=A0ABS5C3Y3_9BACT|nr:hypothetical protein [Gemmata palustris]MBP3959863.1 hypothetical protein [Gemmata palustris]
MADRVYVVGAYVANDDPELRVRAFVPLTTEYRTLDEAVAATEADFRASGTPTGDVTFVVYRSGGGDAIVEVSRGGPFLTAGFYKVALVEVGEAEA